MNREYIKKFNLATFNQGLTLKKNNAKKIKKRDTS